MLVGVKMVRINLGAILQEAVEYPSSGLFLSFDNISPAQGSWASFFRCIWAQEALPHCSGLALDGVYSDILPLKKGQKI